MAHNRRPAPLAICYYGWDWLTSALPDEPYGDLDRALRETRERGFTCIRLDLGLGLLWEADGRRRLPTEFAAWVPGLSDNLHCVNGRGGGRFDVLARVLELVERAGEHGLSVIGTSWIFQDLVCQVADFRLRGELVAIPCNQRLGFLAAEWDRLLSELRNRGLLKVLAFVELVNEIDWTPVYRPDEAGSKPGTWMEWVSGAHFRPEAEGARRLAETALAFLHQRHPDVRFSVDCGGAEAMAEYVPAGAQVADHHAYCPGLTQGVWGAVGLPSWSSEHGPDLAANPVLASLLRPDPTPWAEFVRRAVLVRQSWRPVGWFYHNLDQAAYDRWCAKSFERFRPGIEETLRRTFAAGRAFAEARGGLPLVVDEGYIFYPPLNSRVVTRPEGRYSEELGVRLALEAGYWGILPTGYFRPNTPVWYDDDQCDWVLGLNRAILAGGAAPPARRRRRSTKPRPRAA